jgi:hypothetical protein
MLKAEVSPDELNSPPTLVNTLCPLSPEGTPPSPFPLFPINRKYFLPTNPKFGLTGLMLPAHIAKES